MNYWISVVSTRYVVNTRQVSNYKSIYPFFAHPVFCICSVLDWKFLVVFIMGYLLFISFPFYHAAVYNVKSYYNRMHSRYYEHVMNDLSMDSIGFMAYRLAQNLAIQRFQNRCQVVWYELCMVIWFVLLKNETCNCSIYYEACVRTAKRHVTVSLIFD